MSYDVSLERDGRPVEVQQHSEGGTYVIGGTNSAELNITYNYSPYFYEHLDKDKGLRWLYGRKAKDCITRLEQAVKALGTKQSHDYWEKTAGNAGYALNILLGWAKQHPDAMFDGD